MSDSRARRYGVVAAIVVSAMIGPVGNAMASASGGDFYTIHRIFAHPGLTGHSPQFIKWSRDGRHLTYLLGQGGSRWQSLYMVDSATGQRHVLVKRAALAPSAITNAHAREVVARYHIGSYGWLPSGKGIYLLQDDRVRIRQLEAKSSHAVGPPLKGAMQPSIAPGGRRMAWVSHHTLYYARLDGTHGTPVAAPRRGIYTGETDWVYREELALSDGYAWSRPKGHYLAFLQFNERKVDRFPLVNNLETPPRLDRQYYPHPGRANPRVRLGIRDVREGRTLWPKLPVPHGGYIARFGWLPGSATAYAEVLNRAQTQATLYEIQAATDRVRRLAQKSDPWWVDVDDTPRFLADGRFLWTGNSDGWHHLYLYDANGKRLRRLTAGHYNVLALAGVDATRGVAYFTRYTQGPLNTELYEVPLKGGTPSAVTHSPGVHGISMSADGHYYLDTHSRAGAPPRITLRRTGGHRATIAVIKPRVKLARYHLRPPRFIKISGAESGSTLYAELYLPAGFDSSKRYPVIMYQYGGPDVPPIVRDGWGGAGYLFDELLNRHGFIVFAVDNHAATYFSHKAQASIKHRLGAAELADQVAAAQWLKKQPWVDPGRIGLWGWSFGGYMTAYALTHAPKVWAAGIAVAPVTRWRYYDSVYTERYMGTPKADPAGYRNGSVVTAAARLERPLLIAAGTFDDNVHWQNTLALVQALIKAGKHYDLAVYPRKSHGISGTDDRTQLFSTMLRFWERNLEPGREGKPATNHGG